MAELSLKARAWLLFDALVAGADASSPWQRAEGGEVSFVPDLDLLSRLLAVPVLLGAPSQSGVPALAFDVWTAAELRRAGFEPDRVWPRRTPPRVLSADVAALLATLPQGLRTEVTERLTTGRGGSGSTTNLLGKNYVKQVDVVISSWQTGPELMISTKRMDSSFGKNAANRVEESYGDAKNLSLRHPQAALGFLYGLRSTAFAEEPDTAAWLLDLLAKLGREDDAYDAVALVVPEWTELSEPAGPIPITYVEEEEPALLSLDLEPDPDSAPTPVPDLPAWIEQLPNIGLRTDLVPDELCPGRFFTIMISTVLENSPVTMHRTARALRAAAG